MLNVRVMPGSGICRAPWLHLAWVAERWLGPGARCISFLWLR